MYRTLIVIVLSILFTVKGTGQNKEDKAAIKEHGGRYSINIKNMTLEIDPSIGGRITSFSIDGKDFLTGTTVNSFNWGSTFWTSPQSDWKWPPPAALDNKPYAAKIENNELVMTSQRDEKTGIVVTKRLSGNRRSGSYTLQYTITNQSDTPRKVAPWEITRVHPNGISFFPMGKGQRSGGLAPLTNETNGICWFAYDAMKLPLQGDRKLLSDGAEGWLAQLNDRAILIKKFTDIPFEKSAPKEGEIELFASPVIAGKSYVEMENQGAYEELPPGASSTWTVAWYLRRLPADMKAEAGNNLLVDYVRKLIR